MSAESQNSSTKGVRLLVIGSVKTFLQQPDHATATTDTHATVEELLEAVFSIQMLYKEFWVFNFCV
jgi:hypothetical protein